MRCVRRATRRVGSVLGGEDSSRDGLPKRAFLWRLTRTRRGAGEVGAAVTLALESGYKHIDCAGAPNAPLA